MVAWLSLVMVLQRGGIIAVEPEGLPLSLAMLSCSLEEFADLLAPTPSDPPAVEVLEARVLVQFGAWLTLRR